MRIKYYDDVQNRLLYFYNKANPEFWDDQWERTASDTFANPPRNRTISRITNKYLPLGSRLLEGGCGLGQVVHSLDQYGYRVHGVDFAPNVVSMINQHWSHLDVIFGDVRSLPYEDGFFDGYWSFGVIEHFIDGFTEIADEMYRVVRKGGFLFLTFPVFNQYRQSRAKANKYPRYNANEVDAAKFYQFALNPEDVEKEFRKQGFELVHRSGMNSLLGLSEDSSVIAKLQSWMSWLPSPAEVAFNLLLDKFIGRYAGHSALLIFRRL